jgi:hypothetical protein
LARFVPIPEQIKPFNGMKTMKINLLGALTLVLTLFAAPFTGQAQQAELGQIAAAIKSGNAKALAEHFDANLEITILTQEGSYSSSQAEAVVKNFFAKNVPSDFQIIHKGDSGGNSKYAIGKLQTSNGTFRTYIYVKQKGTEQLIQQLRFERE